MIKYVEYMISNYVDLTITYKNLVTPDLPRHPHIYLVIQECMNMKLLQ